MSALKIIDDSYFCGIQKLWIMQHLLVPTIQWSLLIYEMPMSLATRPEQKANFPPQMSSSPSFYVYLVFLLSRFSISFTNQEPNIHRTTSALVLFAWDIQSLVVSDFPVLIPAASYGQRWAFCTNHPANV